MPLIIGIVVVLLLVAFTVFCGPPYLPSLQQQKETALDLLDLKPGETMLELGCGDGRVLVAAAQRGVTVVGIELSPLLAFIAWFRTRRYRKQVRIICGNYFYVQWPEADAIYTFMIGRQMQQLDKRIELWRGGRHVRLASVAFTIPHRKPDAEKAGVFLYKY
ncbi:MAG TPA: class I SAM-dependent methyltransferase [Candidatus Saccharimonadales bacterium]|nr:class I SAM-dependent methyltransferase [Candidatus Saccharimonadales bacterium]